MVYDNNEAFSFLREFHAPGAYSSFTFILWPELYYVLSVPKSKWPCGYQTVKASSTEVK